MANTVGAKREIRKLVEHLWEREAVDRMTSGTYSNGTGLVILTDRRMFFLEDGWMSQRNEDFPVRTSSRSSPAATPGPAPTADPDVVFHQRRQLGGLRDAGVVAPSELLSRI
ncbi:hypothetical protein [Pseudonocardia abyssalis]|uniref:GRAM domain-containing protein n=1 Tax=Pseudonocardia abyssalis TaxID=2792008 RepID=A0ABS6UVB7_9PSEU|nr:hypothetical protein [Pseudonocardia abyssalis]MBW0115778.1 hypothetical protein [Pseudonocardia abyssalis]MBW0136194.1 hypothetical protein [Pseudonocardia abyssalis]